jgi:hypothetical protein
VHPGGLRSERDRARLRRCAASARLAVHLGCQQRLDRAKERHPDERHDLRFVAANLAIEDSPALDVLRRHEIVYSRTRPGNQIGDAEPELREARIIDVGDRLGHQPRLGQQLPEAIREAGEVMAGLCGAHARIDSDEEHAHAGLDAVGQSKVGPLHPGNSAINQQSKILNQQCTMHA